MFEIFKSGTRCDSSGRTVTISEADVQAAAAAYDPALHEAPIVIGHPKDTAPAWGWVGSLKASGGVLSADFAQVDSDFAEAVRTGRYKKISASFYPPESPNNPKPGVWYLRHVGFLGAQPPAVKGLAAVSFAEDDGAVTFGEDTESLFRRFLRWLTDSGEANTFSTLPELPHEHTDKEIDMAIEEQLAAEKAAREAAEREAAAAKAELKRLQEEQEQALREATHTENADFAENLVRAGRLKPADKALLVQVLDGVAYPDRATADFGEGETKKPLVQALREFVATALPMQLPSGEWATVAPSAAGTLPADFAEVAIPDALSHHERALALADKEGISYAEAARRTAAV